MTVDTHVPPALLNSNWIQLDELPKHYDPEEWEEDEVTYMTLDFGPTVTAQAVQNDIQVLAAGSDTPYARIGGHHFAGRHEMLIGDELLLEHGQDDATPVYTPFASTSTASASLPPLCSSHLVFQPINLYPTGSASANAFASRTSGGRGRYRGTGRGAVGKTTAAPAPGEGEVLFKKARGRPRGSKNKPRESTRGAPRGRPRGRGRGRGRGGAQAGSAGSAGSAQSAGEED